MNISEQELGYIGNKLEVDIWVYGVVVRMFVFHRSDRGSNPGRGGKISKYSRLHYRAAPLASVNPSHLREIG